MSMEEKKQFHIRLSESTAAKMKELMKLEHRSASSLVEVLVTEAYRKSSSNQE